MRVRRTGSSRLRLDGKSALAETEDRTCDHETLNLARALVDLRDLRIAVVALDRELLRVAVAAEDLDRLARLAAGDPGGEELRHRPRLGDRLALVLEARGAMDEKARRLDLRRHVGELLL